MYEKSNKIKIAVHCLSLLVNNNHKKKEKNVRYGKQVKPNEGGKHSRKDSAALLFTVYANSLLPQCNHLKRSKTNLLKLSSQ